MTTSEAAIKESLNMRWTCYDAMNAKIDGNTEGRVEQKKFLARSKRATVRGLWWRIAKLRVMLGPGNRPRRIVYGEDWMGPDP